MIFVNPSKEDGSLRLRMPQPSASTGAPKYRMITDSLRSRIEAGEWKPGDAIPPETELAKLFTASPGTVKKAIQLLVAESLLVRHQGQGTFVARANLEGALSIFFRRFTDEKGSEYRPTTQVINMEVIPASQQVARNLGIFNEATVVHIERLRTVRDTPLMIEHSYLPQALFPDLEREDISARLLYQILEEKYAYPVVNAEEFLQPNLATSEDAKFLGIGKNSPVIIIERFVRSIGKKVIEYRRCVGRGDKYRLHVHLR